MPDFIEKEADALASDALIPKKYQAALSTDKVPSRAKILSLADQLKVSPGIVAGRVRFIRNNYRILKNIVGQGHIRHLFPEYRQESC